jgi:hypothetical protein
MKYQTIGFSWHLFVARDLAYRRPDCAQKSLGDDVDVIQTEFECINRQLQKESKLALI